MTHVKKILVLGMLCIATKFTLTEQTEILNKITGVIKHEAENVRDKIGGAVHGIANFFHPHHHQPPPDEHNRYPHYSSREEPQYPSWQDSHYPRGQESYKPNYSGGYQGKPGDEGRTNFQYPDRQGSHNTDYYGTGQAHPNPTYHSTNSGSYNPSYSSGSRPSNSGYETEKDLPSTASSTGSRSVATQTGQGLYTGNRGVEVSSEFPPFITSGSGNPQGTKGQDSYYPGNPVEQDNPSANENGNFDVDIRSGVTGNLNNPSISSSTELFPEGRSLLAFKGCPEGERKDRAGKCRPVS